jgi:hypothetical protein
MTDRQSGGVRVEISTDVRYARADTHVDRGTAGGAAGGREISAARDTGGATGQPRRANGRFRPYPLADRAARIRALGHDAYAGATSLRDQIAAGADYVRSAAATADRVGLTDPAAARAVHEAVRALMAAGDAQTNALETWRPAR